VSLDRLRARITQTTQTTQTTQLPQMTQMTLPIFPAPQPSFDNFIAGTDLINNAGALQHLRELPLPTPLPGAPVYLWGPPGTGKTHLLKSLAARFAAAGCVVDWFDAAEVLPWTLSPDCALSVIDGCDALDAATQHAAFALFVQASTHGVQMAAAGRLPPIDLPVRDDLRTRLGWGPVFALQALSDTDTRMALRWEAKQRATDLPDEVLDHLLLHFPRDLSHLMQIVVRLDQYALAKVRRLTVPLLREMLQAERAQASALAQAVDGAAGGLVAGSAPHSVQAGTDA
jgi:DnaA-homolog protein